MKKIFTLFVLFAFVCLKSSGQIFTENFESYTNTSILSTTASSTGWRTTDNAQGLSSHWCFARSSSYNISGNTSLAVGLTNFFATSIDPGNYSPIERDVIAYKQISASGYSSLKLSFKWKCEGESISLFSTTYYDYGTVCYSTDGTNWIDLSTKYLNQSTTQTVTNLSLPASLNNLGVVYLGFRWRNNTDFLFTDVYPPGFIVDDISLTGAISCTTAPTAGTTIASPATICSGSSSTLSLTNASTTNVSYQWQSSASLNGNYSNINGATNATYTASPTTSTYYRCNVICATNSSLFNSSVPALVNVTSAPPPTVGTITGSAAACAGASITYSVAAVANATSYAWTVPTGWTITNGGTTNSITVTAGAAGQNGNITVVANNACGSSAGVSTTISINPVNVTNGTGFTTSSTKSSGNITVSSSSSSGGTVRLGYLKFPLTSIPSDATIASSTLSLTNNGSGDLSSQTNKVTALGNNDPTTTAASTLYTAINSGTAYNSEAWFNTGTIIKTLGANSDIQSRISSPGYIAMGLVRGNGSSTYKFDGYNGTTPPKLSITYTAPRILAVTVSQTSVAGTISGGGVSVCSGANSTTLTLSGNTGTIQWQSSTDNINFTNVSGATGLTYTATNLTATTYYRAVVTSGTCSSATTASVTITVNPTLNASIASAPAAVCFGDGAGVNVSSTTGGTLNYTTQVVPGGTIVPHTATLTANSTSTLNDRLEANTTVTLVSVTNATGCSYSLGNSTATIMVNPLPTVAAINGPALIANGATVTYTDATTGGNWSSTYPGIANVISQNNTISRARVNGVSVGTATITYTVGPDGNGCTNVAELPIQVYDNMLTRYRTTGSGNFSSSNWEKTVDNGNTWTPSAAPDGNNTNIEIRDSVTLDVDYTGTENASLRLTERNGTDAVLKIAPTHILSSLGGVDFNGKSVIVQSDVTGSGTIGQMTNNINNADSVTVERYTDGGDAKDGKRAWRLMTSPITGQTIRDAWQEGGATDATSYGTLITGEGLDVNTAAAQGYDYIGAGNHTSIKHYAGGAWLPLSSDNSTTGTNVSVRTEQAYMVFVRGNRAVKASGESVANLRAKGTIFQGDQPVDIGTGAYTVVGNPYASSLDFGSIHQNNSAAIKDQFYLWNSMYSTYGAYVLVTHDGSKGGYQATPSLISGVPVQDDDAYRYIPSGSGFFVSPATNATSTTVTIREQDKAAGNTPPVSPFRVVTNAMDLRYLVVNLNQKNSDSSSILADGFRAKFSPDYEGNEEDNSAAKPTNFNENLGLVRNGINHIIEARGDVKKTDTLQFRMWNVSYRDYQFQIKGDNFTSAPGIKAWLEDSYLGTRQPVDLSGAVTTVDFTINKDSGSWKSTRFRIVFENNAVVLPVTITKVSANPKNGGAEVSWTVSNEVNVKGYTVEKSADGRTFTTLGTQQPAKNNPQSALTNYFGYDAQPEVGDNYYRIHIEGKDGSISYSSVVKVTIGNTGSGIQITLYPNPVREGKTNLSLTNLEEGTYLVSVFSGSGQTVYQKKVYITLAGTTQAEPLLLGNRLAQGSYQIRVADSKGKVAFTDKLIVGR